MNPGPESAAPRYSAAPNSDPAPARVPARVVILGLGAVGLRLGLAWLNAGLPVVGFSRGPGPRERARSAGLPVTESLHTALALLPGGGETWLVLCVPDAELERAAESAARCLGSLAGAPRPVALHTAGCRGVQALESLAKQGCSTGTLHPLAAFSPAGPGPDLTRAWCAISGDGRARQAARRLVFALGARTLELRDQGSAQVAYHAAASLLSNGTVALADQALELARGACADPEEARAAFQSLLEGTVLNLGSSTPERALTGPVSRGDLATVQAHLALLSADPEARELYRLLALRLSALAARDGRLSPDSVQALARLLEP
ncbi:MAG: DUF2520 domain-containing protein [Planctomycetes bacterium]|nr:DUF2520 domain-containing protein [Planctomycetota bacterium]